MWSKLVSNPQFAAARSLTCTHAHAYLNSAISHTSRKCHIKIRKVELDGRIREVVLLLRYAAILLPATQAVHETLDTSILVDLLLFSHQPSDFRAFGTPGNNNF